MSMILELWNSSVVVLVVGWVGGLVTVVFTRWAAAWLTGEIKERRVNIAGAQYDLEVKRGKHVGLDEFEKLEETFEKSAEGSRMAVRVLVRAGARSCESGVLALDAWADGKKIGEETFKVVRQSFRVVFGVIRVVGEGRGELEESDHEILREIGGIMGVSEKSVEVLREAVEEGKTGENLREIDW